MYDITALGELLIDYTPAGKSAAGMDLFEQNPGGAPANVLACASRLGQKTAFIGKIGEDMQGDFLYQTLQNARIGTDGLIRDGNFFTTLAFVALSENGERSFSFARKPGADTQLREEDLDLSLIQNSKIFHFGSLSLTDSPAREATLFAIKEARKTGCLISYDPNFRPLLWNSRELAEEQMRSVLPYVDMIKLSDEETELLTGHADPQAAAEHLLGQDVGIVAVTLGKSGVYAAANCGAVSASGFPVESVDTTGAGDAFWGAFLYSVCQLGNRGGYGDIARPVEAIREISLPDLKRIAIFSNAAAALCVTKRGAIPAMPKLDEVLSLASAYKE
jgi:fructokinase